VFIVDDLDRAVLARSLGAFLGKDTGLRSAA